ncbi:metallophosphoesterase [Clostridium butyricum]|uniref:metallophosphoesterase n=1 Tax=Clostridium butyricum TaxID=1492 RepID=UPI0013D3C87A|nr:metallophosphoesterase [Clostridium butyricum]MCQ2016671.1 metallophosphoesterase [Clostridium butyricum]MCQ2023013.1 metallophosphoesterase [Clostridium butyricum]NFB69672.1 hypothetical protein [Clostridium butyricum]NFB92819.1 hypothetical protein [Clostridium butyricum]UTY54258.1 hypothetical protein HNS01_14545 [Clostridium butyricum]
MCKGEIYILRLLHISDIRFNNDEKSKNLISTLIKDLIEMNNLRKVDMILITGDLIDRGGLNFESAYDALKCFENEFICKVEKLLDITRDRIFFVPGNHDVNIKNDKEYVEAGLKGYLNSVVNIENFIDDNRQYGVNSDGINRINDYKRFEMEFYDSVSIEKSISKFESTYIVNINGYRIGISSLNTAWRYYNKENKVILGEKQILNSQEIIKNCDLKLALMHHSYESLDEIERRNVKGRIQSFYDYLFLGHVHNQEMFNNISLEGKLFISIAQYSNKSNIEDFNLERMSGYSIFDISKDSMIFYNRRYSYLQSSYINNNELLGDIGYKKFDLGESNFFEKSIEHNQVIEILEDKIDELNEDLLIYSTDSKAPKNLGEIFIEPTLEYADDYKCETENDKKTLSIQDIIDMDTDTLILGTKESGKTILVDKMIIELIQKNASYKKIPVKINFSDIKNIKKDIKNYLGVSNSKLEKIIKEDIILFIENFEYNEDTRVKVNYLKDFKNTYANSRFIFTMRNQAEGNTPLNIIENDFLKKFQRIYIKSWNSKKIELLANKWFADSTVEVKLNEIINIFSSLRITANPLNISMLLWIIEHQTDYSAINNAKLLETFFDHLLQKLDPSEICSSKFDYSNKIRLLSEIALYIYEDNTYDEYRVQALSLDSFVNKYLENRKFSPKYKSVMTLFKERGILLHEQICGVETVRFRFECFFRYFLMQNMINKDEFREKVISKEKYLEFEDEIDYFTGIKRDQEYLLKELNDRMMAVYSNHIDTIRKQKFSFDSLLEISEAFTNKIEDKDKSMLMDIKKITPEAEVELSNEKLEKTNRESEQFKSTRCDIEANEEKIDDLKNLFIAWNIVAKVLKNTEEIDNGKIKNEIYNNVLQCSIVFCIINKLIIEEIIKDKKYDEFDERDKELFMDSRCILFTHQILLREVLGSQKLEIVIQEEIDRMLKDFNIKNNNISEAELYTSVFLLLDINKNLGIEFVQKFIKVYKRNYIKDMLYLKLSWYYRMNRENDLLDKKYLDMIREVLDKNQAPKIKEKTGKTLNQFKHNKMLQEHLLNKM